MEKQQTLDLEPRQKGPVECLGMTFESDEARRAYFMERLKEKLQDPEFRKIPGFPKGTDEDILRMSDPPYYTACPNPFLAEFVRVYGRPYDPNEEYHREPFAVDVSVGKSDALYKAHSYHTKVPHLAIVPSVQHYTRPGDIILDAFSGSGMVGVASRLCSDISPVANPTGTRVQDVETERTCLLVELSPAATFISYNYNTPLDLSAYQDAAKELLDSFRATCGWMYETSHVDGRRGQIDYTVWSQLFTCPNCAHTISFLEEALDANTKKVASTFCCPNCVSEVSKSNLEPVMEVCTAADGESTYRRIKLVPALIRYSVDGGRYEKKPDLDDLATLEAIPSELHPSVPDMPFPIERMYHGSRLGPKGLNTVDRLYTPRASHALGSLWAAANAKQDVRIKNFLLYMVEQAVWTMSVLNSYRPTGFSQVSQYMKGVYYAPAQHAEVSPWYVLEGKARRLLVAFAEVAAGNARNAISTQSATSLDIPSQSVDYIFTDPPFGENIFYADLNFLIESWHRVWTATDQEAILDKFKGKRLVEYQSLMRACFQEYYRVLKPRRWITIVFSNSSNAVWRAIQEAIGTAGFVVADIRTLDKQQGSYRQVTSSAVKQDLVISAYKPRTAVVEQFGLRTGSEHTAWVFVPEHLTNVPLFVAQGGESEVIAERTPQMLLDRMIAFHVQRGVAVPLDAGEFFRGLEQRYAKRDGMYFLHDQVLEYDRKRAKVETVKQLSFMVTDEASAILWVRAELERKPQSFQDLQPVFMREIQSWAGHEKTVELKEILEENFLLYDGSNPVPAQIHTYLSTNFKDMRGLSKDDPILKAKAADRWFVPDPNKQSDLDQLRSKRLLKEFLEYKESKQKRLKLFRTEAVRAGFKAAYDQKDYRTIVDVAKKLPEQVVQEDEKLLMYYDVALMRLGED